MFGKEDTTFKDIREQSVLQWLTEMEKYEDVAVYGGVRATMEYIDSLKKEIENLKDQNALKDRYLKQLKEHKNSQTF